MQDTGVVVLLVYETDEGPSYLLLEQDREEYGTGVHYAPPAGTFDPELDDSPKDTAIREVYEETGIELEQESLEELFETNANYGVDRLVWYRVRRDDDDSVELNHEAQNHARMTLSDALEEELLEDTRKAFNRLI